MTRLPQRLLVLAHRGFHVSKRENTLAAFEEARPHADGVEFDVRFTQDHVAVVHHDPEVVLAGTRRPIADVASVRLPAWLPRLDAVLAWGRARAGLVLDVEVKAPGEEVALTRMLSTKSPASRTVVTSFHPDILYQLGEAGLKTPCGLLVKESVPGAAELAQGCGASFLAAPSKEIDSGLLVAARDAGLPVWAWGVNTLPQARRLRDAGVSGLITDRPDRLSSLRSG